MGANSHIEWTDHTFNPWEGCTKVSPGCAHCYAEARNQRFAGGANWGKSAPRRRTSEANWKQPLRWNAEADEDSGDSGLPSALGHRRPRVFCASLADWLDDEVPIDWLADLFNLIRSTPNLDWLLLTKRPENWAGRLEAAAREASLMGDLQLIDFIVDWRDGRQPANIWVGTTVEDQVRADERIPALLSIPARVRFLSCEPLLGPVELTAHRPRISETLDSPLLLPDWVICGGESGPAARPMHPDWARSLRNQCDAAGVPFFFKQWGEWVGVDVTDGPCTVHDITINGKPAKKVHDFGDGRAAVWVGKKSAGRLLDGKEHNALPEAAS